MKYNKDTKLKVILQDYPRLKEELPKIDERLKIINSPVGKMMLSRMTLGDAAEKTGFSVEQLQEKLAELLERFGAGELK